MKLARLMCAAVGLCALATTAAFSQAPAAAPPPFSETVKIADGVYEFRYQNHNSLFVVTSAGVLVTDPISFRRPEAARLYLSEIRKLSQAPIRYMIYSHSHFDHSTGGKVFKDAGARVIAQRNARDRLLKVSNPDVVPVDEVVDERRTIDMGGMRLDLIYLGRNHSDSSLAMLLPKEKVLYTVDWVSVGAAPGSNGFGIDTYPDEWIVGLNRLLTMDWDRMVLGHGAKLGTKADVQFQIDYMTDTKALAKTLMENNNCTPEGRAAVAIPAKYQAFATAPNWDAALNRYCLYWLQGY